ncbi:MAG: hypothetical protein K8R54_05470 [Bacteroidales bacterium]|nr:hypothetical protein [Bacteroidales bacterium]
MKVTGFTIIRNALKFDYPIIEAIQSILPLCDDFVVAVGNSEDDTLNLIKNINSEKIQIIETVWDDTLRKGGQVLAVETNKAFAAIPEDTDWCFYIQADEVLHEKYYKEIQKAMKTYQNNDKVDGLLFKYLHFYGSYDYIGSSSNWYRNEIRIIKNNKDIYSYKDAQGFRKENNLKLNVKTIGADIYHYGWVKEPEAMQRKQEQFHKLWHSDDWLEKNVTKAEKFDYSGIDALNLFDGTHPECMKKRIKEKNWKFDYDLSYNKLSFKEKFKKIAEKITGSSPGEYKNYKIV